MKTNVWRRFATLLATAGLAGSLGVVGAAGPVLALNDPGCLLLGGSDATLTCVVPSGNHPVSGSIAVGESVHLLNGAALIATASGVSLTIDPGSLEMDKGSSIRGGGKNITITVPHGDMVMHGTPAPANDPTNKCGYPNVPSNALGAQITSIPGTLATTITISVGNILATPPTGSFTMERCSVVNVSTGGNSAGTISILSGHDVDIDGLVLSESTLSGTGAKQAPGGGPISIRTSCALQVSQTGVVSSKGHDPGADLVRLEGCDVLIDGLVQSTGPGHVAPNNPTNHCFFDPSKPPTFLPALRPQHKATDTACVEVWAEELTISSTGEVNANVNSTGGGGPQGTSWIDLFAEKEISVTGRTAANATFSVHADSLSGTDTTPNTITVLSHTSTIKATGKAFSASDTAAGSYGGTIDIEASLKVTLDGATVQAAGHDGGGNTPVPPCSGGNGNCGAGGKIIVRSWTDAVSWASGVGNVSPDVFGSPLSGTIVLTACVSPITTGANFGPHAATAVTQNSGAPFCGVGPALPSYVEAAFSGTNGDRAIWTRCAPSSKSGMKFKDVNGNGVKDPGDLGITGWPITLTPPSGPAVTVLTDSNGNYTFAFSDPGLYTVCEGPSPVAPATWAQTFPNASTVHAGETVIKTCPTPNIWGYQFTLGNATQFTVNDFGNWQPPTKTGVKFNDLTTGTVGVKDTTDPLLPNWTIQVLDLTNTTVITSAVTDASGNYTLTFPKGGQFHVCEVLKPTWTQTYPNASTPPPGANDTVLLGGCPGGLNGYLVTVQSGDTLSNDDFGNNTTTTPPVCQKGPVQDVLNPVTGNWPGNLGPDYTVRVNHGGLVQAAVDAAAQADSATTGDINGDGVIIILVLGKDPIGTLGGSAAQSVDISADYTHAGSDPVLPAKQFALIGCSVTLTGDGTGGPAIHVESSANALNTTPPSGAPSTDAVGGSFNIFTMDLHGGNSSVGIQIDGDGRYSRNQAETGNGTGLVINGNNNTVHSGNASANTGAGVVVTGNGNQINNSFNAMSNGLDGIDINGYNNKLNDIDAGESNNSPNGPNGGDGVHVVGNSNSLTQVDAFANVGDGIEIFGDSNQLNKNVAGDKGKGNGGDGIKVAGASNDLQDNDASTNTLVGFEITNPANGAANLLKNNRSNTGNSGDIDYENVGAEFSLTGLIKNNGGGNKIDSVTIPNVTKISTFPATNASFNYTSTVLGE